MNAIAFVCQKKAAAAGEGEEGPEGEGEEKPAEEEPVNKQTMRDFVLKEKGDLESWRCILPSGTVVRYRNNGDAQVNLLVSQSHLSNYFVLI